MFEPELLTIVLACLGIYVSETYACIIGGGGGFLVQPILIALGLPPAMAVSHDMSACLGSKIGGAFVLNKHKQIRWDLVWWWLPSMTLGGFFGAWLLSITPAEFIEKFIGILALVSVVYFLFLKKDDGIKRGPLPKFWKLWSILLGLFFGIYLGFSGAGAGVVFSLAFVSLFRGTMLESFGIKKVVFIPPILIATVGYFYFDLLIWQLFIPMFLAAILAGATGSWVALKIGNEWLKRIFIVVVSLLAIWLLLK